MESRKAGIDPPLSRLEGTNGEGCCCLGGWNVAFAILHARQLADGGWGNASALRLYIRVWREMKWSQRCDPCLLTAPCTELLVFEL